MKKVTIGHCDLYCGDMRDILPSLGQCADLVLSDVPYPLTSGGSGSDPRRMSGKFAPENYKNDGSIVECDIQWKEFMPLLYTALKENAHCYTMSNDKNVREMLNTAHDSGFRFHNLLVWDKGNVVMNRWYAKNVEFIGFFFKGHAFQINDCGAKQLIYVPQEPYGDHPTPKPTLLMKHYIEMSTKPDQVVLDPFMGVGSTGVAAVKSHRRFIGIEINEKFFHDSCKRIEEAYKYQQEYLF